MSNVKQPSWWAASTHNARRTAVAAGALAAVLIAVSCIIWVSPSGQSVYHAAVQAGDHALVKVNPLYSQNAAMKKTIAALKKQVWHEQGKLKSLQAASLSHQSQSATALADMQQKLSSSEQALASAQSKQSTTKSSTVTSAGTGGTGATALSAPTKAELLNPTSRYYGLYTQQAPFNYSDQNALSTKVGASPNMVGYFQGWDQGFRADAVTAAWTRHELPVLTWESQPSNAGNDAPVQPAYSLPTILSGTYDAYITQYAQAIVATGLPLVIRFDHEMNGVWYPWSEDDGHGNSINGNQPGDYVKVWQHVWNIFQAQGANQDVIWDWSPNIVNNLTPAHKTLTELTSLYPGDAYVDWVGLSGYLRPPFVAGTNYTFDYTFGASLALLRSLTSKHIILSEIGASDTGGYKVGWINSLFSSLAKPQNADIIGFAWFDMAVTTYIDGQLGTNDWRIDSRPDTLSAFIAGLTNPSDNFGILPPPS